MEDLLPRCEVCLVRHLPGDECAEPTEEGHLTLKMLADAFRGGSHVCLPCQAIYCRGWHNEGRCPGCGQLWERFAEDDLALLGKPAQ